MIWNVDASFSPHPMLLIAVPQMGDPNFAKAVVLILQHNTDGAFGLVINRPTEITLDKFAESQELTCHGDLLDEAVFRGGPVQVERGWILHADESVEEKQVVIPGLYVSTGSLALENLLERGSRPFRLFLGYSGWGAGQLEKEMIEGAWITAEADVRYVFDENSDKIWNRVLTDLGVDPNRLMVGTGLH
jgi:putative transcriptional regulator